jgi:sugar phosphate isomerase/epimerase
MAYIQLPVGAFHREQALQQCAHAIDILQRHLPSYSHGIQVFMGAPDEYGESSFAIVKELVEYATRQRQIPIEGITIHHPYAAHHPDARYHFFFPESMAALRETAAFAQAQGIPRITLHLSTVFYPPTQSAVADEQFRWRSQWDDLTIMQKELAEQAYHHLRQVACEFPAVRFGIENIPLPIKGDRVVDPALIMIDPLMYSTTAIRECMDYFSDVPNVGVCVDTAHFLLAKACSEWMNLNDFSLPGVYFPRAESADIMELIEELIRRKKLVDVQLSDAGQHWIPFRQLIGEGTALLSGLGGRSLLDVARCVLPLPDIGFSLDLEPQREHYTDDEWPRRYCLKKEQVHAIELLRREHVL